MPTDTGAPHNLPYPTPDDTPHPQRDIKALAEATAAAIDTGLPPGTVTMFAGAVAPPGWLRCDGRAVSRATYQALWNAIAGTYGTGDGSTTFNLPNLENRVPVGVGSRALGATGGAETVALTTAQLPAHAHPMPHDHAGAAHSHPLSISSSGAHSHPADMDLISSGTHGHTNVGGAAGATGSNSNASQTGVVGSSGSAHTHTGTASSPTSPGKTGGSSATNTQNAGSGQAHENMPPFVVLNYIIKT